MRLLPDTDCSKTQWRYYQKHQIRTVVFNLIGATLLGLIYSVTYAVPMMTNYQGTLQDTDGNPLNTSISMTFSLYDTPEGGTPLWTETHPDVTVTNGVFSVVLGSVINFTAADFEGERYLGVTVGTDEEMLPRQALVSTSSSIRAGVAEFVADLSGHNATELDDLTSVGSGAIITAEEREKLGTVGFITIDLTTGVGTLEIASDILVEGLTLTQDASPVWFGAIQTDLWRYDWEAQTSEVICSSLLGETEALEVMPNGQLLVSSHQAPCGLYTLDTLTCELTLAGETLSNPFQDMEGIAMPVAACFE